MRWVLPPGGVSTSTSANEPARPATGSLPRQERRTPVVRALFGYWLVVATFVRSYEEPTLSARYGESYDKYRAAVPGWWPRLRAWSPPHPPEVPARIGD